MKRTVITAALAVPAITVAMVIGGSGEQGTSAQAAALCDVETVGDVDLDPEQLSNAAVIARIGQQRGVPTQGWVVAIATALQESSLRNIDYGDRDSLGLFQQRPSQGWGDPQQLLDPVYATGKFYDSLTTVDGWEQMPVTVAAQTVQRSAFPNAYAQWEPVARASIGAVAGAVCAAPTGGTAIGNTAGEKAFNAAMTQLGVYYSWGGGTTDGPSEGFAQGAGLVGFDCSSLVQYAYHQATGVTLPRTVAAQSAALPRVDRAQLQVGDLLVFNGASHIGIYDGTGGMVHAPRTGKTVEVVPDVFTNSYWSDGYEEALRVPDVG